MIPSLNSSTIGEEWSFAECLRVLSRRKFSVLWMTCLGILATLLLTAGRPRVYQSRASLEIQAFNENFLNLRDIYPAAPTADAASYMQTQTELLQQDALLEQVGRRLSLADRPEFQSGGSIADRLHESVKIVSVRNSRVVQVVSDARNPKLAADIANTLAAVFIEQSIDSRQRAARQTYESLQPQLDQLRRNLAPSVAGSKAAPLSAGAEATRASYRAMLQKANEAWIASRLRQSNIQLIGPAVPASRPYKPNVPLNLAIGSVGSLLLAIGFVMLQEQNNSVLRVPGEATTYLTLPELGAIPQAGAWTLSAFGFPGPRNGKLRVERASLEQRSGVSESFRATLASMLTPRTDGGHPRVIVVTSSRPMEGKTTVVSNLGIALAGISKKVLLIDGDMRRPRLHRVFDQANSWGLSDVLREKNAIDELPLDVLVKKTSVPHLYLLPSGASTENIFGLLYSDRMSRLFPLFRAEFDYVLVDAPPCLEFADARIMARYAEELLLVVRANHTDKRTVQAAVQRLRLDGIPLMGVILNRWNPASSDAYAYPAIRDLGRLGVS